MIYFIQHDINLNDYCNDDSCFNKVYTVNLLVTIAMSKDI